MALALRLDALHAEGDGFAVDILLGGVALQGVEVAGVAQHIVEGKVPARLADKEEEACLWAIESTLSDEAGLAGMRRAMEKASNTMCRAAVCAVVEQLAGEKVYA